jgi:hypothetical protein
MMEPMLDEGSEAIGSDTDGISKVIIYDIPEYAVRSRYGLVPGVPNGPWV